MDMRMLKLRLCARRLGSTTPASLRNGGLTFQNVPPPPSLERGLQPVLPPRSRAPAAAQLLFAGFLTAVSPRGGDARM
jgi:hypothetical protein